MLILYENTLYWTHFMISVLYFILSSSHGMADGMLDGMDVQLNAR